MLIVLLFLNSLLPVMAQEVVNFNLPVLARQDNLNGLHKALSQGADVDEKDHVCFIYLIIFTNFIFIYVFARISSMVEPPSSWQPPEIAYHLWTVCWRMVQMSTLSIMYALKCWCIMHNLNSIMLHFYNNVFCCRKT